jgi:hypothetical protein
VGAAGFLRAVALGLFPGQVVAGGLVVAALGDRHDVEHAVDGAVAEQVEAMSGGHSVAFSGGDRDRGAGPPPVEGTPSLRNLAGSPTSALDGSQTSEPDGLKRRLELPITE